MEESLLGYFIPDYDGAVPISRTCLVELWYLRHLQQIAFKVPTYSILNNGWRCTSLIDGILISGYSLTVYTAMA